MSFSATHLVNRDGPQPKNGQLPDFIVLRDHAAELRAGVAVVAVIITDQPHGSEPTDQTCRRIDGIIVELLMTTHHDTDKEIHLDRRQAG